MKIEQGYDFDDVLIIPRHSNVNSRTEVDISVNVLDRFVLGFPVIASPMRGIVDANFCIKLAELGSIGILHRFYDSQFEWQQEAEKVSEAKLFGLSVGLHDINYLDFLKYKPSILLLDVANGYTQSVLDFCKQIKKNIDKISPDTLLMAGNIATKEGADNLYDAGVDMVRCGIGPGGLCSTRNITGVGIPQLTAIEDCSFSNALIVADGGIRNSGDAVKAFAFGAEILMAGGIFAQTYESPSEDIIYGMASRKLQDMKYTQTKSIEGIERAIVKTMSLKQFIEEFSWGIKSACTYLDAKNLSEIYTNARFILAGNGSIKKLD